MDVHTHVKMCIRDRTLALTDRLDYLGAHQNRHALCMCIEKAMGIEVSDRVKYIRTIMDELQRIDSHLLFYSALAMDLGALTAFFYGFRDREKILDIFEETCGGRLIMNYNTIGGVQADLHPNFVKRVKEFIPYMRGIIHEYHDIFTGNIIAQSRMKGVGVLSLSLIHIFPYPLSEPTSLLVLPDADILKSPLVVPRHGLLPTEIHFFLRKSIHLQNTYLYYFSFIRTFYKRTINSTNTPKRISII